jgi:hypothetical protein
LAVTGAGGSHGSLQQQIKLFDFNLAGLITSSASSLEDGLDNFIHFGFLSTNYKRITISMRLD